ncbi:PepSY domain-containing protein [Alkalilimnicola ehrlichii MLHE-1]|uniref:Propeptide, PepSY amd peptidase M4 n=1 Tax=Alkalilimnicola ehrlichii (strain ATCC BAA-1101 / DSM 17681 / MLHE-1) TaxID=187272 RepID=Q0A5P1_ALKEH|nr:propeptide, PepSY amd peptidase M4 [Alkalilimnicola ehrlichii]ABI57846.1 propeptide, PepSY amd peptidase M4 [Alkalilimnicola ehrlichii MLHE-1]
MNRRTCLRLLCATPLLLLATPAPAGLSEREAVARVREHTDGRVLGVERRGNHYRVRVLVAPGQVRVFRVDARTGEVR